jgi:hypothetical protein
VSALSKRAAEVEAELGVDWTRYHVAAQLKRFATGVLVTVLWSLHSGTTDWTDVLPLAWTAMWVTAAQMWPQVPWSLLRDRLHAGAPPTSPGPPA